jgi:two-component system response regulator AtoC
MPLEAQPKLLRILESNQLTRIGGIKITPTDIRIISSTNQDLLLAVKKGNFREDLLYRINTVTVDIPPLRERKDDIPILVKYICNKIGRRINKNNIEIDKKVLEVLCEYNWPGNIRELENALESAIILSKNNKITIEVIPENIKPFKSNNLDIKEDREANSLIDIEKEVIFKVLKEVKGNISKASRALGIDRSTLYRKIEKYKISK